MATVIVQDDGRGVPVGKHSTGKDALEVVHTVLHAGGKFGGGGYKVSGGLHGVGVSVVNALSEWMRVESARDGSVWMQEYERGKPKAAVKKLGPQGDRRGTTTIFRADPTMFSTIEYSFEVISERLRESAYLTKGVWITLIDERVDRERSFYFEGGLDPSYAISTGTRRVSTTGRSTSSGRKAPPRSRSRSSTTIRTPRTSWHSRTTSIPSTVARTSPASARRSRAPSTIGPAAPGH